MFDASNRLNQVTGQESYRYDGQGRRVQATQSDSTNMFWQYSQAGQVLYVSDTRRSRNTAYLYLGNTLVAMRHEAWGTGAVTVSYQHTDALGSPVAETDAVGAITQRHSYAPYGEAYNAPIDGPGYTGHVMDAATGLTYMQQRYYDPVIGRFLSVDPMPADPNSGANFNRYWYGSNNPYRFTDPDGRMVRDAFEEIMRQQGSECRSSSSCSFALQSGGSENAKYSRGCGGSSECEEVKATRSGTAQEAGEQLKSAGIFGLKFVAMNYGGGLLGRFVIRLGRFLNIGRMAAMSRSASVMDRNGLTVAGRALQKHGGRDGSAFPRIGHKELNDAGQRTVDEVLASSGGKGTPNRFGGFDYRAVDGKGARFGEDDQFIGFLEL